MLVNAVISRLKDTVPDLGRRVEGIADWAKISSARQLPQRTPSAFVLPLGKAGGESHAISGLFRQGATTSIGVLLIVRARDDKGARGLSRLDAVLSSIENAILGWQPEGETDCFELRRSELLASQGGALVYQFDFSILQQLRVSHDT
jgi:hypothetical protein